MTPLERISVVVLAAGRGTRFLDDPRYSGTHKTLIPVFGKPMSIFAYENSVTNLEDLPIAPIFVTSDEIVEDVDAFKEQVFSVIPEEDGVRVFVQGGYVNGPAATSKLLYNQLRDQAPILFVNADQYVKGSYKEALLEVIESDDLDGALFCFTSSEDRYSYVSVDSNMIATDMVEKQVVGDKASTGICFWKTAKDYFESIELVDKEPGEELFISNVHAAAIAAGKKFKVFMVDAFIDLGTPADLDLLEERWEAISE